MIVAASTHNARRPYNVWLEDLVNLGFRYLDIEYIKAPEASMESERMRRGRHFRVFSPVGMQGVRRLCAEGRLKVISIEAGALAMESSQAVAESEERIRTVIGLASSLDATIVSLTPHSFSHGPVSIDGIVDACSRLSEYASSRKVKLALENGERGSPKALRTPRELLEAVERVGSEDLGLCLDLAAAATYDFNVSRFASKLINQILIVHVNDITRDLRFKNIIVGLGDLDFHPLLRLFRDRDIPMVIEIFSGYGAIDLYLCKRQIERLAT